MRCFSTSGLLRVVIGAGLLALMPSLGHGDPAIDRLRAAYKRPVDIPFPASNPYSSEKAALGKALFFDPRLSGNQNMTCASCHNPSFGWKVPLERAIGSKNTQLARNAPTLLNLAWGDAFFWDGRAPSLEVQAKYPIEAEAEMNLRLDEAAKRLDKIADYQQWFAQVFPRRGIAPDTITMALATYERTIVSGYAPFDAWVDGDDAAMSQAAKAGFALFNGKGRCASCHVGWNFTDNLFHDIGTPGDDVGRAAFEPGNPKALHAFKTPGLRDITQRAPYLHDGSLPDLDAVLVRYVSGGIVRPSLAPDFHPVALSNDEIADIIAFLTCLTADKQTIALPILPH